MSIKICVRTRLEFNVVRFVELANDIGEDFLDLETDVHDARTDEKTFEGVITKREADSLTMRHEYETKFLH